MRRVAPLLGWLILGCTASGCQGIVGIEEKKFNAGSTSGAAVDTTPLRIGMPTVLQGVSQQLGIQMKRGVDAWFKTVNDKGGIKGAKKLELVAVNDDYEPASATKAIQQLLDVQGTLAPNNCAVASQLPDCVLDKPDVLGPNKVLSILGQVGTPTMSVTAPVAIRNRVVYFGPFTGAQRFLRDSATTSDVVFNYRAGYYEEEAAVVDYLFRTMPSPVLKVEHIIGFTQNDSFGDAGYKGFQIGYGLKFNTLPTDQPKRINYTRNDVSSVEKSALDTIAYLKPLAEAASDAVSFGIFMVPAYAPAAEYIKQVKERINADDVLAAKARVTFINVSFVGADALLDKLKTLGKYTERGTGASKWYGDGVWITQVVPSPAASLPGVVQYRAHLSASDGGVPSWGSLEGYLAARLFTEGLERTAAYDTTTMIKAYESIKDFDLGVGPKMNFDNALPEGHQASHTVWFSQIKLDDSNQNGTFDMPWLWKGPVSKDKQIIAP